MMLLRNYLIYFTISGARRQAMQFTLCSPIPIRWEFAQENIRTFLIDMRCVLIDPRPWVEIDDEAMEPACNIGVAVILHGDFIAFIR